MNSSSTELYQLLTTGTFRYVLSGRIQRKKNLLSSRIILGVLTDPLPSNKRSMVALIGSCWNVFSESLPSNGSIQHSIFILNGRDSNLHSRGSENLRSHTVIHSSALKKEAVEHSEMSVDIYQIIRLYISEDSNLNS
jgi:hypothetical protein